MTGCEGDSKGAGAPAEQAAPKHASKTLVFGGSFDPPHTGHLNLLANGIAAVAPSRVVVVPAGTAPHKAESHTPAELRLAMCACFQPAFPGLEISDLELRRPGKSYTWDTLLALQAAAPDEDFCLLVGGDMLAGFTGWYRWQDLLARATLVAGGRHPNEMPALEQAAETLRTAGGRVILAEGPVLELSSSGLRAALARGDDAAWALIPPPADAIAREHRLYTDEP
ncbi:nicotinate (nicotinamide) nucleotide adenylyltransferase [Ruminococcaceae bacterium OttesenSCG-928-D13]|nr:nicotinate (nicotinamide) nucleotide adenylyltransferase [Ruminococcaceae bacterium OttesenSCG-928-D13]